MKAGTFTLAAENPAFPGCTISGEIIRDTLVFSMAEGTDISPESYPVHKIWLAVHGALRILAGKEIPLDAGQCYVTPVRTPVGIKADTIKNKRIYLITIIAIILEANISIGLTQSK